MSTSSAPSETAASSPPPVSFELTFRPTGQETLHALLTYVPRWMVYISVFIFLTYGLGEIMQLGIPPQWALVGLMALAVGAPHLAYAALSRETHLRIDDRGVTVGPPGAARPAVWETMLRVRVTRKVHLFTLRSGEGVVLPNRVIGPAERRLLDGALAARPALVTRKEPASFKTAALWILGILVFVTVYNLFQTAGPRRPRQPKSGNTPTSSLRMASSTDATGRSSFIEPTI